MPEKKKNFEEAVSRIHEIVRLLERGDTPLDESIKLFEEGAKLAGLCETLLQKAEQRVVKLCKTGADTVEEQPFEQE